MPRRRGARSWQESSPPRRFERTIASEPTFQSEPRRAREHAHVRCARRRARGRGPEDDRERCEPRGADPAPERQRVERARRGLVRLAVRLRGAGLLQVFLFASGDHDTRRRRPRRGRRHRRSSGEAAQASALAEARRAAPSPGRLARGWTSRLAVQDDLDGRRGALRGGEALREALVSGGASGDDVVAWIDPEPLAVEEGRRDRRTVERDLGLLRRVRRELDGELRDLRAQRLEAKARRLDEVGLVRLARRLVDDLVFDQRRGEPCPSSPGNTPCGSGCRASP